MSNSDTTDFDLSLQTLEASDWGEPDPGDTHMVKRVYSLRRKALRSLTDDEVRLAIGQRVGFPFVLDLAFERLRDDPLLEGGCYPGDILSALIRADEAVWHNRPHLREKLSELYCQALAAPTDISETFRESLSLPQGNSSQ